MKRTSKEIEKREVEQLDRNSARAECRVVALLANWMNETVSTVFTDAEWAAAARIAARVSGKATMVGEHEAAEVALDASKAISKHKDGVGQVMMVDVIKRSLEMRPAVDPEGGECGLLEQEARDLNDRIVKARKERRLDE